MFKYKGVNLIKSVYRPYLPLMFTLFLVGFSNRASWKKFIGLDYQLQDAMDITGTVYYPEYHLKDFAQRATKHIFKNKKNFLHLKRETLAREKAILSKNRATDLKTFFVNYLNYQPTLALYHICDDFIEDGLRQELLKKISAAETNKLISYLNLPLRHNIDYDLKRWFLKTRDVDGFIKKYSWFFSRYGHHNLFRRSEALAFLNTLKKDKGLVGEDKNRSAVKQAIKRAKAVLRNKAYYVDVMQFFVYYRTQRTDILNKTFFSYYDQLVFFARELGISYDDLVRCSYEELISGRIPNRKILQERKKATVVCFSHGKIKIISGPEINYFKKLSLDKKTVGIITGRTAFPGLVSGPVKIIRSNKDFAKIKKGDILVTAMTTPSMAPIMKKAAAFITDEGGITCHAAILAREMKKPCVIGTKKATGSLKDGDLVEVDANQGNIRLIN